MSRLSRPIDRAMFLRAIAEINRREPASAVKIAERLQIPKVDARDLAADEVRDGYLVVHPIRNAQNRYVSYRLTPMAESMIGAAV